MPTRVLMLVTSVAKMKPSGLPTGTWLEELAAAYNVFADAGAAITIASVQGGAAPIDEASLAEPWLTADGERFRADAVAMGKMAATAPLGALSASDHEVLYLVGGAGTAWDFPGNQPLADLVSAMYARGGVVGGVCHGVLGLTSAVDGNGGPLVAGRNVTGISNREEELTGYDKLVPVLPEDRLRQLGAIYSMGEPLMAHVVQDGRLVTGQNPASARPLATIMLKALG